MARRDRCAECPLEAKAERRGMETGLGQIRSFTEKDGGIFLDKVLPQLHDHPPSPVRLNGLRRCRSPEVGTD